MVRAFGIMQDEATRTNNPPPGSQDIATNTITVAASFTNTFPAGSLTLITFTPNAAAPTLTITHSGNSVTISWPLGTGGFALQQNNNVADPAGWSNYGGTVSTNNGMNSITLTAPTGNQFYRLFHQ